MHQPSEVKWEAMDLELSGKAALVTGSTSGLGLASARALAAEGASVVICGRRRDLATREAAALGGVGVEADLTDPDAPGRLDAATLDALGGLYILVGSTGGPPPGGPLDAAPDAYDDALHLLVTPMVRLAQLAVPEMRKAGGGRIVFVTSSVVREPVPSLVLSNAVRMAVHGFAKTLAKQVASEGITVNCVLPGRIATDRTESLDRALAERTGRTFAQVRAGAERAIPAGRYGDPPELGAVVAFLCSGKAGYVTGASILVDGGAMAGHW